MALDVAFFALLTAASWGASSPLSKLGMERGGTPYQAALTVVFVSLGVYWSAVLLRGDPVLANPPWVLATFAVTGLMATAVARGLSYTGVHRVGASVNSAAQNTRPVWAMALAVVFLGEVVTPQIALGIAVVVTGLVTLAFSGGGDIRGWRLRDLAFPLASAFTFAAGNVIRRFVFTASDVTPLAGVAINETAGLVGLLAFLAVHNDGDVRASLSAPRDAYAFFVGCGLLSALALFALFEALSRGQVVVVDPLSSPTSLFAILFAVVFLRDVERITTKLVVGAVLVVTGVVFITGPSLL